MQDLIRHLPAVIYEYVIFLDGVRHFNFVSEACESILGLPADAVMMDPSLMESIVHPQDLPDLLRSSAACEAAGTEWHWQGRMLVNERIKWVEIRSSHELMDDGVIVRRGIILDVTANKETAKDSEVRYQSLIEKLPIGVIIYRDGIIVFANGQAVTSLSGEKNLPLVGRDVMTFVGGSRDPDQLRSLKPGMLFEQKLVRLDGKVIDVEVMTFSYDYLGHPSTQIIFRDITGTKETETRIKKNEMLLAQLFQNAPMAVVLLTDSGKVEQVNRGFEEMFGYTLNELKGRSINDFIVPDELSHEGVDLNNLITSHRVVSIETIRRHRNGKSVNVILYGMPVMLDNQTIGIYGVYVDITERKRVEEELQIRNAELDNFVYKVSHDLRAPLSSILGLVNLSKLPGNTDNPMDYMGLIGSKVEHLDHFISDVLSHSKNLKMEVTNEKVNFSRIIDQTFNDLNYLEGAKGISKLIKVEGIDFYSDPWRIAEILRNLISNAIKYRKLDQVTSEIGIKINVDHLRAELTFADNGIGIDEENLAKIFEMFYRATEQSDGSGIGLYIVKNAVEKLGGQITVASRLGHGTRFHILLPNRINSIITTKIPTPIGVEES